MSNPAVIFGRSLLPSIKGRSSFLLGVLEPVNLCRPKGYCAGGRPSHPIFRELRKAEVRRISLLGRWVNKDRPGKLSSPAASVMELYGCAHEVPRGRRCYDARE